MKAWRVHQYGAPGEVLQLDDVDEPAPGAGELKIRVTSVTLNFNDLDGIHGRYKTVPRPVPYIPGMEVLGVVEECGAGRRRVARPACRGDPVAARSAATRSTSSRPPRWRSRCRADMPEPEAAAIFMPFHLAWLALYERARVQAGRDLARARGRGRRGIGRDPARRARRRARVRHRGLAREDRAVPRAGAELAINYRDTDFAEAVLDATGGRGVDVAFDAVERRRDACRRSGAWRSTAGTSSPASRRASNGKTKASCRGPCCSATSRSSACATRTSMTRSCSSA